MPLEVVEVEVRRREWDGGGNGGGVKERAEGGDGGGHGRGGARSLVLWRVSVRSLLRVISLSPTLLVLPIRPGLNGPIPIGGAPGLLRNARAQRLRPTKDPLSVSEDKSSLLTSGGGGTVRHRDELCFFLHKKQSPPPRDSQNTSFPNQIHQISCEKFCNGVRSGSRRGAPHRR